MKKLEMVIEWTSAGYSAYCESVGAYTVAGDFAELKINILEALNLALQDIKRQISWVDVKLTYDLESFFEAYTIINAAELAKRLTIPQSLMAQYMNGLKKPSAKQTKRILEGARSVGRELAEINLLFEYN